MKDTHLDLKAKLLLALFITSIFVCTFVFVYYMWLQNYFYDSEVKYYLVNLSLFMPECALLYFMGEAFYRLQYSQNSKYSLRKE